MKANELLDKALNFIVETQENNDYICEQMCEDFVGDYCEKNCQNLNKDCVKLFLQKVYNKVMKANEVPEKYKACDWMWNYGSIGLTKEHIKRLNNVINILESLNEHTDAKYLNEIKGKLLEDTPNIEKINTDAFIETARKWFEKQNEWFDPNGNRHCDMESFEDFKNYMKEE